MPISKDPVKAEKQLSNLQHQYGRKLLAEIQSINAETTKKKLIELAPNYYPNLSALARAANVSRSLVTYYIANDKDFALEIDNEFNRHLDEIEVNVLSTAKKEQYAGIGLGVLNKLHPRYKEEKQNPNISIALNFNDLSNPYKENIDVEDAQIVDSDTPSGGGGEG